MSRAVLVQASPLDPATGAAKPVRLAGGGSQAYAQLGFTDWRSGLKDIPRFQTALGFDANGWTGGAVPQSAALRFMSADPVLVSTLGNLYWRDAPLTVTIGDDQAGGYALTMTAKVADVTVESGTLMITIGDMSMALNKPVLSATFAGTGGIEGGDDATGRAKRRSWGRVFNVEGYLLSKAYNIYEFGDPSKPLQAFEIVRDKGRAGDIDFLDWQGSIDATFAALIASSPPEGGGVVCPSISCVKWWTDASGPLTADIYGEIGAGYVETAATVAQRMAAEFAGPAVTNVPAIDAIRPAEVGLHCADASETVADALNRLLIGVSLLWVRDPEGTITLRPWTLAPYEPVETLTSYQVSRKETFAPVKSRKLGFQRNHRIHSDGEISSAILATDAFYPDGTPVADLQPAEAAAQITRAINLDAPTIAFTFDDAGDVAPGQLPRTIRAYVTAAAADITLYSDWSITTSGGVTATINNSEGDSGRGTVTITGVTGAGSVVIHAFAGGVYLERTLTVTTKGALADKTQAGTGDLIPGSVTAGEFFTAGDVAINSSEVVLIETPWFTPGDGAYGQALALATFLQDSSEAKDTAARVRAYLDEGSGYSLVRDQVQGLRTADGDTFWSFPATIPITINSGGSSRIKITAQGVQLKGGGNTSGSAARYIRIDLFQGAR